MGVVASQFRKCVGPKRPKNRPQVIEKSIQILVVGDAQVGKSTLVDSYIGEVGDDHEDVIRYKMTDISWTDRNSPDTSYNVSVKIVDVKSTPNSNAGKEQRSIYYDTSDMIIVIYNVGKQESIYHVENKWNAEINEALQPDQKKRNQENKVKLIVLGVNPEARFELEESNMPKNEDFEKEEFMSRLQTKRNSVKKADASAIAGRMSIKGSVKQTAHYEVKNKRENIVHLFKAIIKQYIEDDITMVERN